VGLFAVVNNSQNQNRGSLVMVANYLGLPAFRGQVSSFQELLKRGFDIAGATAGLILLSPLILFISLAIKVDSRGPVLCRLKYYKLDDAVFDAFEFRSTICDPRNNIIETTANRGHNITRIGQILRSSGIDKIPQFINVLRGDMSLVGPQPLMTACGAEYRARIDPKLLRNVRPGVVGWAQIQEYANKANHTSDTFRSCIESDCYYLANRSLLLDMKILFFVLFVKATEA
jgi:lipopolysaccharide/colanic/teichoic acid biosynthesis glycosyltransferase